MSKRPLDLRVIRGMVSLAEFHVTADPDDHDALLQQLVSWLQGEKWDRGLWGRFHMEVRYAGEGKVRKTIRAGA